MRLNYFWFFSVVIVIGGFWFWTGSDYAKEVVVVNEPTPAISAEAIPSFTIPDKIKESAELLKKSPPLDYETKYYTIKKGIKIRTGDLVRKQIALAILNKNTGEIFEKRVWVKEQDIKNYKKTGVITPDPIVQDSTSNSLAVEIVWWNSFNTFYEISGRPELVVVANKYLLSSKYLSGLPEKSSSQYTNIIYTPYSKQLHSAEIVEVGKMYLDKNIDQAFAELESAKVRSRFMDGTAVTEGIDKNFIKNIITIEHIDPDSFKMADDGGRELSERVLAVIGANQSHAYRYTGSPAGASGLAQFIQSTYKNMVSKYPEAKLIKDYNAGMANHVNAIKAMVLFFDAHKKDIAGRVTRKDTVKSIGITEEMLAAAYNGGPSRVVSSVNKFGLAWISNQITGSAKDKIFRRETLDYIKKFRAIKGLDLF